MKIEPTPAYYKIIDNKIQEIEKYAHDGIYAVKSPTLSFQNIISEARGLRKMLREMLPQVPAKTANEGEGDAA